MKRWENINKITCAYLYTISKYGYPPDITNIRDHIAETASLGFRSIELEGIGQENIEYLFKHKAQVAETLAEQGCSLAVLCLVLPQLSAADRSKHGSGLEIFEMGCETAAYLGTSAVLDNGPLLPMNYPENAPVKRHYPEEQLLRLGLPEKFVWTSYWEELISTYQKACSIAARYSLDFHMHPCEGSLITDTNSFINFSNAVDCANLKFNLDTANQYYFRDNLPLSVLRLSDKIGYIHISDNRGHKVEHLVPGDGNINWDLFFGALQQVKFQGKLAIDVGGAETGIIDMDHAYSRTANWLDEQINQFLLNRKSS